MSISILGLRSQVKEGLGIVKGTVRDENGEVLPLVNVYLAIPGSESMLKNLQGASSDLKGFYSIEAVPGRYILTVSAVGYTRYAMEIQVISDKVLVYDVQMNPHVLDEVVYSESRNPTRLEESTVSIALVKPSMIQQRNATSADMAIEQIPGVAIVDAEPQIRGGSGFSSGLGSRVLLMIDDMPLIRGDAGRPVWSFYPMENMAQIEVLKGAGSVLYGSGASNGVINIRTAFPRLKPETRVTVFAGTWNRPADTSKTPWTGFNPVKTGMNFYHSRILQSRNDKYQVDFVVGGQALWDDGYRGGEPLNPGGAGQVPFDTSRINKGEYEQSIRANFNTRVRLKSLPGLSFGLNGNMMYMREGMSFFWGDTDKNLYKMLPSSLANFVNTMAYLDPYISYTGDRGTRHIFRSRFFVSNSDADVRGSVMDSLRLAQDAHCRTSYTEYQFSKDFSGANRFKGLTKDLKLMLGAVMNTVWSKGGVFSDNGTGDSLSTSINLAAYVQLEKQFFSRLTITGGARFEYFKLLAFEDARPVLRVGSNLRLTEGTFIRGSLGEGFRFPTIGERFISVSSGGSGFFANPGLKPESSWSAELGVKQMFKIGKGLMGYVDLAGFWQEYDNFVEFAFENVTNLPGKTGGFRFHNTGKARIRGFEFSTFTQFQFHKSWSAEIMGGYTYSLPQTLEPDKVFGTFTTGMYNDEGNLVAVEQGLSYASTVSDLSLISEGILKYRIEHLVNADIQVSGKWLSFGYTLRYYSTMRQIDGFFTNPNTPFGDVPGFLQRTGPGAMVHDARIAVNYKEYRLAFIVENLFNAEYSVRPLGISPLRLTTLQFSVKF
jgi:outer membrane receptor protein involved in Fe transport